MSTDRYLVGIDVGTTKVCTVVGVEGPTGKLAILGYGLRPSQGLRKGSVVNIADARLAIRSSIEEAADQAGVRITSALVGVTGSHIQCRNTKTAWESSHNDDPISSHDLEELISATTRMDVGSDRELLHVIPRSYVLDRHTEVRNPLGMHATRLDIETHVVTGALGPIDNLVQAIGKAGVKVRRLVLEPLASAEAVLTPEERELGVVLVDMGGGTTDISIFQKGTVWHTSIIPVGGVQMTNDLSSGLGLSSTEAEQLKVTQGTVQPEKLDQEETVKTATFGKASVEISRSDVSQILTDRCSELLQLVLHRIGQAGLETLPPSGIVFTGGCAALPGLEALAHQIVPGRVRIGAPSDLDGAGSALEHPAFATSVGILLWEIRHHPQWNRRSAGYRNGSTHKPFGRLLTALGRG